MKENHQRCFDCAQIQGRGQSVAGNVGHLEIGLFAGESRGRDIPIIRWITADDNHAARSFYDRVAKRTTCITYDMDAGEPA